MYNSIIGETSEKVSLNFDELLGGDKEVNTLFIDKSQMTPTISWWATPLWCLTVCLTKCCNVSKNLNNHFKGKLVFLGYKNFYHNDILKAISS